MDAVESASWRGSATRRLGGADCARDAWRILHEIGPSDGCDINSSASGTHVGAFRDVAVVLGDGFLFFHQGAFRGEHLETSPRSTPLGLHSLYTCKTKRPPSLQEDPRRFEGASERIAGGWEVHII